MTDRAHKGLSLIEVLIALLVLSVGLLGLSGLYLSSLKLSHDSQFRSLATIKAEDISEQIRAFGAPGAYLVEWQAELGALLPAGGGDVLDLGDRYEIRVWWQDRSSRFDIEAVDHGSVAACDLTDPEIAAEQARCFRYQVWKPDPAS